MAIFTRTFRSGAGNFIASFLGGPSGQDGPAVPLHALAHSADQPVDDGHPLPTVDAALAAAVLSLVNQQVADDPGGFAVDVPADDATDVVAAASSPRAVRLYLRSAGSADFVTFKTGADAQGADSERRLLVGQHLTLFEGRKFTDRVSVFAAYPSVIEVEFWG
ncbi:hypothetical protein [Caulobacter sp. RL271]|uniref:Uncharacterized protein n=1 Tax=Caulobacter segnis TaxID=88688 RepID=A0ABY4ZWT3_9CAUL|nr:hypothetical protein [Caulobacter segnis]USQ97231.1 hypothetical protein MZV50_06730 [Caulobacter segnis]